MQQQQIYCTKITTVQNEHLFMTIQSFLVFWPLNDQITVSFVRAAGVLAKGHMFDMPALHTIPSFNMTILRTIQSTKNQNMSHQSETIYKLIQNDMRKFNVCEMVHHNEEKCWFLMKVN